MVPDRIESVQRRAYFRVKVPASMKVNTVLWHRANTNEKNDTAASHYQQGRLMDLSAGGAQVVIGLDQEPDFKKGQFIGMRFTPLPYEQPVLLNAQIRNILPTADQKSLCLGLQLVGLEASKEGREVLQKLCSVVERYYQIQQQGLREPFLQN